jgi:hypothetical protein
MNGVRRIRFLLLVIGALLWFGIGGELLCRFEGDWRLDTLALKRRPAKAPDPAQARNAARAQLATVTYQKGVDPAWFFLPPARIEKPLNQELQARTAANPTDGQQENFIWNDARLHDPSPGLIALLRHEKLNTLFAFPSYQGSPLPLFRLYPDTDFRPTPWITDHWGWLSVDVTVHKPPGTVRVGIIGDSTSHNSYGFYLQTFLDAWALAHGFDVRFEVLNTGRQGFGFEDGLAALQYELGPMGLDYIYEYFAPSFSLVLPQMVAFATLPPGVEAGKPSPPVYHGLDLVRRALDPPSLVSALTRRIRDVMTHEAADSALEEPAKPRVALHLPRDIDGKVAPDEARKDPYFAGLLSRFDRFRAIAASLHATPFVSSERLCVWDGMVLRNGSNRALYQVLNGPLFWPFSYADLRRMAAVHNGTISAWAAANGVTVVDIDGRMPRRPELCNDAHHDNPLGQQMRAWLIFQAMVPQISHDLRNKLVPRDNAEKSGVHPYLDKPIERLDREEWLSRVEPQAAGLALTPAR